MRDDERGVVVEQLADVLGGLALPISAPFAANRAQSGGVTAAFRGKVAAEAEHMHPPAQPLIRLVPPELPGDANQLLYVIRDAEQW